MSAKSVVVLNSIGSPLQEEALCSVAVKPGYLLARNTDGTVKPHATAAASALDVLVAVERTEVGEGIDATIPIGDTVKFIRPTIGDKLTMWLKTGITTTLVMLLESAGDGTLQAATTGKAPFRAAEVLTSSGATKLQVTIVEA